MQAKVARIVAQTKVGNSKTALDSRVSRGEGREDGDKGEILQNDSRMSPSRLADDHRSPDQ